MAVSKNLEGRASNSSIITDERLVLPPGYGRAVGVEIGERLPVGSDYLFCYLFFGVESVGAVNRRPHD